MPNYWLGYYFVGDDTPAGWVRISQAEKLNISQFLPLDQGPVFGEDLKVEEEESCKALSDLKRREEVVRWELSREPVSY